MVYIKPIEPFTAQVIAGFAEYAHQDGSTPLMLAIGRREDLRPDPERLAEEITAAITANPQLVFDGTFRQLIEAFDVYVNNRRLIIEIDNLLSAVRALITVHQASDDSINAIVRNELLAHQG